MWKIGSWTPGSWLSESWIVRSIRSGWSRLFLAQLQEESLARDAAKKQQAEQPTPPVEKAAAVRRKKRKQVAQKTALPVEPIRGIITLRQPQARTVFDELLELSPLDTSAIQASSRQITNEGPELGRSKRSRQRNNEFMLLGTPRYKRSARKFRKLRKMQNNEFLMLMVA